MTAKKHPTKSFFDREPTEMERPHKGDRILEVKVLWGPMVLDVRHFGDDELVTAGEQPKASFHLGLDSFPGALYTLASPGGPDGHVVHVAAGMGFEVRHGSQAVAVDHLALEGAVRTYALKLGDRARVMIGQLAFVIQYVSSARGATSGFTDQRDFQLVKWWATILVIAFGLWLAMVVTPSPERRGLVYAKSPPALLAQLITPAQQKDRRTFEGIEKRPRERPKVGHSAKWKKGRGKIRSKRSAQLPREIKEKRDRMIATNAGILRLLKAQGGGTGHSTSSVFGGAAMARLDQSLEGLRRGGSGDSGGFGGLATRGGGPGGGGLGLGGRGTAGYGRGAGDAAGSVRVGHRGKVKLSIRKGRTKIVGGLSQDVVGGYIRRYWAQFKFCYERELSKDPNLYGKVTTTFTIAGNGRVAEAQILQTSMHNDNVEQCLLRVIRRIRFPAPKGGGEVIVTYPFLFTTAG